MENTIVKNLMASILGAFCIFAGSATAASVDLSSWTAESYSSVSGFPAGSWSVASGGGSVYQSQNGQPTFFYSDFNSFGTSVTGKISVSGSDDDFIGFALGFRPGDSANTAADYLLIDWKRGTQTFDFGTPSSSGGGSAPAGLAVSRVTGVPDADEFWQHDNLTGTPAGSGLTELARASTLGSTGWSGSTEYKFSFDFGPNNLVVKVDDVEQFNLSGSFSDGRLAFYNFSQAGVTYSAFTVDTGSFPAPVPEPEIYAMMGLGLGLLGWVGRRKRLQAA